MQKQTGYVRYGSVWRGRRRRRKQSVVGRGMTVAHSRDNGGEFTKNGRRVSMAKIAKTKMRLSRPKGYATAAMNSARDARPS